MTAQQKARPDGQSGTGFTTPKQTQFTPAIWGHFPPHFWQSSDASTCNRLPLAGTVGDNKGLNNVGVIADSGGSVKQFSYGWTRSPNKAATPNKAHRPTSVSESSHPTPSLNAAGDLSNLRRAPMQTQSYAQQADTNAPAT